MRSALARAARVFAGLCVAALPACSEPYAKEQYAHRLGRIEWVLDSYREREQRSPENLATTFDMLEDAGVVGGEPDHAYWTAVWMFH